MEQAPDKITEAETAFTEGI